MEHEASFLADPHTWVNVGLVIFILVAGPKIWKALGAMLDQRALRIKAMLDEAQKLRDEAEALLETYRRKQQSAKDEAEAILSGARASAEHQRREAMIALDAALARRERASLEKIAQAEAAALAEVKREAIDIAAAAARKLIVEGLDEAKASALVDRAIVDMEKRVN